MIVLIFMHFYLLIYKMEIISIPLTSRSFLKEKVKTQSTDFIHCISQVSEWEEAFVTMLTFS